MSDVYEHNKRVLATLIEGDAVEFRRGLYSHWGIYIGNEKVIHVTGIGEGGISDASNPSHVSSVSGKSFNKATVRIDNFFHVASGWKAWKNNSKDIDHPPKPVQEIIEKAMAMIGDIDYNVFGKNCEHFVSYCRNGIQLSDQVNNAKQTAEGGILSVVIGFILYKLGLSKKQQKDTSIGSKKYDKADKDKGPDSHNLAAISDSDNPDINMDLLETDLNADGPVLSRVNKGKLPLGQTLGHKRQNTDQQIGNQSDNKNDKGTSGSNNLAPLDNSIKRVNIVHPFVTYLNADGFDLRSPTKNVDVIGSVFQNLDSDNFTVSNSSTYPAIAKRLGRDCYASKKNDIYSYDLSNSFQSDCATISCSVQSEMIHCAGSSISPSETINRFLQSGQLDFAEMSIPQLKESSFQNYVPMELYQADLNCTLQQRLIR